MEQVAAVTAAGTGLIKLNIGCGLDAYPGWYNYDNSPTIRLSRIAFLAKYLRLPAWPRTVIAHDVLKGLPWETGSVDFIYSSHAFEHFTYEQSLKVAKDCHRALKPGGALRIVVPDLRKIISEYFDNAEPLASHTLLNRMGIKTSPVRGFVHPGAHHQQVFDARSLCHMLREAGFSNPADKAFGYSRIPDIAAIELERRAHESLYVEAIR